MLVMRRDWGCGGGGDNVVVEAGAATVVVEAVGNVATTEGERDDRGVEVAAEDAVNLLFVVLLFMLLFLLLSVVVARWPP